MKILVDTQIFLWAITEDRRLSITYRALYMDGANELYLSVASIWEMLIKAGLGKLPLPKPAAEYLEKQIVKNRLNTLGIHASHFTELEGLPPLHRDPFDRMLVAQAKREGMPVMSADPAMRQYGIDVL